MDRIKFLIVPDSFKNCISSEEVSVNILKGIKVVFPDAITDNVFMADGGEGTIDSISQYVDGEKVYVKVRNPLNVTINSFFYVVNRDTAIVEMALASGVELLKEKERNALITSSYGTGELIMAALDYGCKKIIVGLGGSATNDAGVGMAKALGVKFLDKNGEEIGDGGGCLNRLHFIDDSNIDKRLFKTNIIAATDVTSILIGKNGASLMFGKQKGVDSNGVKLLEVNLNYFANKIKSHYKIDATKIIGGGAAGGLGVGLKVFCNATIESGFKIISELIKLEEKIKCSDIIITAEGKIDRQTNMGKTPIGVGKLSKKYNKPVFVFTGDAIDDTEYLHKNGVTGVIPITRSPIQLDKAIKKAPIWLQKSAEEFCRIIKMTINLVEKESL